MSVYKVIMAIDLSKTVSGVDAAKGEELLQLWWQWVRDQIRHLFMLR